MVTLLDDLIRLLRTSRTQPPPLPPVTHRGCHPEFRAACVADHLEG